MDTYAGLGWSGVVLAISGDARWAERVAGLNTGAASDSGGGWNPSGITPLWHASTTGQKLEEVA